MKTLLTLGILPLILLTASPTLAQDETASGEEVRSGAEILSVFDAAEERKKQDEGAAGTKGVFRSSGMSGSLDGTGSRFGRDASAAVSVVPDSGQNFSNILFKIDSTEFADSATLEQLRQIALAMKARPEMRFLLEGHTCDLGSDAHNLNLSRRRGIAVRDHLFSLGVAPIQVMSLGFGEREPLVPNTSEARRKLNRRVVIQVRN